MVRSDHADGLSTGGRALSPEAVDELLGLLANARRRLVLDLLAERGESSLDDLAREVLARERERDRPTRGSADEPRDELAAVRASLFHCHLPRLADVDVVTYDREDGRVAPVEEGTRPPAIARFRTVARKGPAGK